MEQQRLLPGKVGWVAAAGDGLAPLLLVVPLPWHPELGKKSMQHAQRATFAQQPSRARVPLPRPAPAQPYSFFLPPRLPAEVYQIKEEIEDRSMTYPAYYTVPFHGGWAAG